MRSAIRATSLLAISMLVAATASASATITIRNTDTAGVGFNDPTPATPVGGNAGTTVGAQRMNAFLEAARIWGQLLDSNVEIVVDASFAPLACTDTTATLGSAGPTGIVSDFPNAPKSGVWYPLALANKLAGTDLNPGHAQIRARFNGNIGQPGCLSSSTWYYGLDAQHGAGKIDLVVVLLHEFAHGLGVIGGVTVNDPTSTTPPTTPNGTFRSSGLPFIYDLHALDTVTGLRFDQATQEQRAAALVAEQKVVWDGDNVRDGAAKLLDTSPILSVTTPGGTSTIGVNAGTFGTKLGVAGFNGTVVAATDAAEKANGPIPAGTTLDGCSAITNAAAINGNIALVNAGTCTDTTKAKNVIAAGARGMIVADTTTSTFPYAPFGTDPAINLYIFGITKKDADVLRGASSVSATFARNPAKLSGADANGLVKLYTPSPASAGSTYSHFDQSATPNLLMEPRISDDLTHDVDLTLGLLLDIGWGINTPRGPSPIRHRGVRH